MGFVTDLFGALRTIGRSSVIQTKLIQFTKGGITSRSSGAKPSPRVVVAAGTAAWGVLSTIGYVLLFLMTVWILPILIAMLSKSSIGLRFAIKKWEASIDTKIDNPFAKNLFRISIRIIPEFLLLYSSILVFIVANIVALLALCTFIFIFIYFVERHLNDTIESISNAGDLVIEAINFGGSILEIMFEVRMYLLPITNMMTRYQIMVFIHLYDGMVLTINSMDEVRDIFTGRRLSQLGAETFFDSLQPMIQLGQMVYNIDLAIVTTVIDIFFAARIINIVMLLGDILMILISKLLCYMAGISQACCFRETIDFLVFNIIIDGFLNPIIGIFGASIPLTHDIACPESVLVEIGINAQCGGGILSLEPYPGIYINAPRARRMLISCEEISGEFHEYVGDHMSHATSNQTDACPHARNAFHEFGNSQNMQILDTHGCYDICVQNVLFESCPDGSQKFKGKCGNWNKNISMNEGRRRLDTFFQMPTGLQTQFENIIPPGQTLTRSEMVNRLRDRVNAVIFSTDHGRCDLSHPPTNIYEILYDGICVISRLYSPKHGQTRRLQATETIHPIAAQAQIAVPALHSFRHSMRRYKSHTGTSKHAVAHTTPLDSAIFALKTHLNHMKKRDCKSMGKVSCPRKNRCADTIENCAMGARPMQRRKLDTICEDPQVLCPNAYQCVDNLDTCIYDGPLTFLGRIRSYIYMGISGLREFNIGDTFYDVYTCWKGYMDDTQTDPYWGSNIYASKEDLEGRVHWCMPMYPPSEWTFVPWEYSLRSAIRESCVALSQDFKSCACPMFYPLPSTSLQFLDFMSSDLGFILMNGVIFFKNIFAAITHNVFGYIWSSFCAYPTCSREVSHALSLYSTIIPTEVYIACGGLHLGSASVFVLVSTFVMLHLILGYHMIIFISSGGKTRYERSVDDVGGMLGVEGMRRQIDGLKRQIETMSRKID